VPKIKTRKGIAKRVRVTSTGKLVRSSSWRSHMLEHKSQKRKRKFRDKQPVDKADRKAIRRALAI
jgi:large subunit ribosomal protein L35